LVAVLVALAPGMAGRPVAAQSPAPTGPAGSVVRIPFPRDDGSLTPFSFQLGYPLMTLVYDTLLWRDTTGTARPWLARSLETSPDATRFTLHLNPGARWHDGTPVTADDVRFTFGYVAGRPSARFSAEVAEVASVAVPDRATVVITTRRSAPGFADQTLADLPILPAHLWQNLPAGQDTPSGLAVGSGPYRLVERPAGGGYRFEANTGYFMGTPSVSQIVVPLISDFANTLSSFRGRDIDLIPLRLPPDDVKAVEGITGRVARGPSYWGAQLVFNVRRPPFDDPQLRQAVAKAIDLDRLARTVGDSVPADQGLLHPASTWAPGTSLKVTDEAGAKTALAGVTQSVEVLSADNDPVHLEAARQVALALERAGLKAASATRPVADLNRALGADGAKPDFTLAVTTLGPASSYDPDFLARLFGSATATTSGYSSAAFDKIAGRVATTVDPAARRTAVTEELRLLATDLPTLPLLFPNGAFAYRPSAHDGWQYVKGVGVLDKQSFLGPGAGERGAAPTTNAPSVVDPSGITPADEKSGRGLPFALVPIGMAAAAVALMALAVTRRRR